MDHQLARSPVSAGYSLVEVLVVAFIISVLTSLSWILYSNHRDRSDAKVKSLEAIAFAKGCASRQVDPNVNESATHAPSGEIIYCNGDEEVVISSKPFLSQQTVECMGLRVTGWSLLLVVDEAGTISCR